MATNAAAVSRALAISGFPRSMSRPGNIKGLHERSTGFEAWLVGDNRVRVQWIDNSLYRRDTSTENLTKAAVTLRDRGFDVEVHTSPMVWLIVSRPEKRSA